MTKKLLLKCIFTIVDIMHPRVKIIGFNALYRRNPIPKNVLFFSRSAPGIALANKHHYCSYIGIFNKHLTQSIKLVSATEMNNIPQIMSYCFSKHEFHLIERGYRVISREQNVKDLLKGGLSKPIPF